MSELTPYLLYLIFAVGAVALYLRLPRGGKSGLAAGAILGTAALLGLLVLLHTRVAAPVDSRGYFYLFSIIAVVAASRVVTHPRPVWSALYFILVVMAVAALLVLYGAEFLAVALVIVYAGAILVTYLFVIMLAQQPGSPTYDRRAREPLVAAVAGFVMTGVIAGKIADAPPINLLPVASIGEEGNEPGAPPGEGNTLAIGQVTMTRYVVALEIAGTLLLISMIGAVALSRKKIPVDEEHAPRWPLGRVGKEVEPF